VAHLDQAHLLESLERLAQREPIRLAPHSPAAEVAIVVADDAQGKGVGRVLMEALAERARANGVQRFIAVTGAGNRPFRRLMERLGPTRVLAVEADTIELETVL
jgi:GNAT superfamily N-acetyltransferase